MSEVPTIPNDLQVDGVTWRSSQAVEAEGFRPAAELAKRLEARRFAVMGVRQTGANIYLFQFREVQGTGFVNLTVTLAGEQLPFEVVFRGPGIPAWARYTALGFSTWERRSEAEFFEFLCRASFPHAEVKVRPSLYSWFQSN